MVHNCIVSGCKYRKRKNIVKGIVFHSFPVDPARLKIWVNAVHTHSSRPVTITRHSKICQHHFRDSDYLPASNGGHSSKSSQQQQQQEQHQQQQVSQPVRKSTRHLKPTAVPSIFVAWNESAPDEPPGPNNTVGCNVPTPSLVPDCHADDENQSIRIKRPKLEPQISDELDNCEDAPGLDNLQTAEVDTSGGEEYYSSSVIVNEQEARMNTSVKQHISRSSSIGIRGYNSANTSNPDSNRARNNRRTSTLTGEPASSFYGCHDTTYTSHNPDQHGVPASSISNTQQQRWQHHQPSATSSRRRSNTNNTNTNNNNNSEMSHHNDGANYAIHNIHQQCRQYNLRNSDIPVRNTNTYPFDSISHRDDRQCYYNDTHSANEVTLTTGSPRSTTSSNPMCNTTTSPRNNSSVSPVESGRKRRKLDDAINELYRRRLTPPNAQNQAMLDAITQHARSFVEEQMCSRHDMLRPQFWQPPTTNDIGFQHIENACWNPGNGPMVQNFRQQNFNGNSAVDRMQVSCMMESLKADRQRRSLSILSVLAALNEEMNSGTVPSRTDSEVMFLLHTANLQQYYCAFMRAGGDDVAQLCRLNSRQFNELVEFVGMDEKPFHVKRLRSILARVRKRMKLRRDSSNESNSSMTVADETVPSDAIYVNDTGNTQSQTDRIQRQNPMNNEVTLPHVELESAHVVDIIKKLARNELARTNASGISEEALTLDERLKTIRKIMELPEQSNERESMIRELSATNEFTLTSISEDNAATNIPQLALNQLMLNEAAYHLASNNVDLLLNQDQLNQMAINVIANSCPLATICRLGPKGVKSTSLPASRTNTPVANCETVNKVASSNEYRDVCNGDDISMTNNDTPDAATTTYGLTANGTAPPNGFSRSECALSNDAHSDGVGHPNQSCPASNLVSSARLADGDELMAVDGIEDIDEDATTDPVSESPDLSCPGDEKLHPEPATICDSRDSKQLPQNPSVSSDLITRQLFPLPDTTTPPPAPCN